nr:hypothetical protein [Tanacetum cinerariifolium]
MPPRMRTRSAGQPVAESLGGGTGVRVGRGERGRRPREGNDERVDDLNGQENNQGMGANGVACTYEAFVSVDINDILTNDEFPILNVGRKIISEDNGGI